MWLYFLSIQLICLIYQMVNVNGHGRLMEPPARNTMWRFGFPTIPNYEDSEMFCGGIKVQWQDNKGKCGICGDPYNGPREYETGGSRTSNITVRTYFPGSVITVLIDIVANHAGKFDFSLCWRDDNKKETEECFEPLKLENGDEFAKIKMKDGNGMFLFALQLPPKRTCSNCILRWNWKTANNWGVCPDGSKKLGCGPQETYRNCADIKIDYEMGIRGSLYQENIYFKKRFIY